MFTEALVKIAVSSLEIGAGAAFLYFLYSLWRDLRDGFLR